SELLAQSDKAQVVLSVGRPPTVTRLLHPQGSRRGGKTVTIIGTGFSKARTGTTVAFGRIRAPFVRCRSTIRCTARTPPGSGTVRITVTVAGLASAPASEARYMYTR